MCRQNLRNCLRLNVFEKTWLILSIQNLPETFPHLFLMVLNNHAYLGKYENFADISHYASQVDILRERCFQVHFKP